MRLAGIPTSCP